MESTRAAARLGIPRWTGSSRRQRCDAAVRDDLLSEKTQVAIFEKKEPRVLSDNGRADFSRASIGKSLSGVGYDKEGKFFYVTFDRVLFSDPASTIKAALDAHGFAPNLENILACLDSCVFGAYATMSGRGGADGSGDRVDEYAPCILFELPQKTKVGVLLQSFYDEIGKFASKTAEGSASWLPSPDAKALKDLRAEAAELREKNKRLQEQVSALTLQLSREQRSLSRVERALDSQRVLPDNVRICRVERVDLKRRVVKVSCNRKSFELPTHILDRVPELQARCLIAFEGEDVPAGVILLDRNEADNVESRVAELLYVEGDSFKARDSRRNEIQVRAVNPMEAHTIMALSRGMKVIVSISEGYVVRFAVLGAAHPAEFATRVREQLIVHEIGRNPLVVVPGSELAGEGRDERRVGEGSAEPVER